MKTFVASVIIFTLLAFGVFLSSAEIRNRAITMYDLARSLPYNTQTLNAELADDMSQTKRLCALWDESLKIFSLFMDDQILEKATEAAQVMRACSASGESNEFFSARIKFADAMQRILRLCGA